MRIRKRLVAAGVAGALGIAGIAVAAPVMAATDDTTAGGRVQALVDALAGLVSDGTLTQAQADAVATTLDESDALRGPGGHGPGGHGGAGVRLDAAADALGMTADELRTALQVEGTSLADVAEAQGVETQTLVDALVAAATEHLQELVASGELTQAEADERVADLPARVAEQVAQDGFGPGHRGGPGGMGRHGDGPAADDATGEATADAVS